MPPHSERPSRIDTMLPESEVERLAQFEVEDFRRRVVGHLLTVAKRHEKRAAEFATKDAQGRIFNNGAAGALRSEATQIEALPHNCVHQAMTPKPSTSSESAPRPAWISTGDQLPGYEYDGEVLVVGIMTGEVSMRSGRYVTALANEAKQTGEQCAITHWMPAPEAPHVER